MKIEVIVEKTKTGYSAYAKKKSGLYSKQLLRRTKRKYFGSDFSLLSR